MRPTCTTPTHPTSEICACSRFACLIALASCSGGVAAAVLLPVCTPREREFFLCVIIFSSCFFFLSLFISCVCCVLCRVFVLCCVVSFFLFCARCFSRLNFYYIDFGMFYRQVYKVHAEDVSNKVISNMIFMQFNF